MHRCWPWAVVGDIYPILHPSAACAVLGTGAESPHLRVQAAAVQWRHDAALGTRDVLGLLMPVVAAVLPTAWLCNV